MEATLISTSRPSDVYSTPSARSTRSLLRRLTMATTRAPRARTRSTVRLVSVVVPDWLMATTSVSDMSAVRPKPESSVAGRSSTMMPSKVASSASRARATDPPATAAVPWPMTRIRRIEPSASPARTSAPSASSPRRTRQPEPSPSPTGTSRPRRVARTESGDSPISLSRKWGWSPRSMSRVVISARATSASVTGNDRPS